MKLIFLQHHISKASILFLSDKIDAMIKSSDEFAEKAEKLRDVTVIAKSNSLHCTAKDKELDWGQRAGIEVCYWPDQLEVSRRQMQDL